MRGNLLSEVTARQSLALPRVVATFAQSRSQGPVVPPLFARVAWCACRLSISIPYARGHESDPQDLKVSLPRRLSRLFRQGISFNDDYARGVFCVGIPYPSIADPKVVAKKRYNNWKADTTGWAREDPLTYRGRGGVRRWRDIVCDARDAVGRSGGGGSGDGSGGSRGGLAGVAEADANAVFGGNRRTLSGDEWYGHQAFRALNQVDDGRDEVACSLPSLE